MGYIEAFKERFYEICIGIAKALYFPMKYIQDLPEETKQKLLIAVIVVLIAMYIYIYITREEIYTRRLT
jgi:hypothetical protein